MRKTLITLALSFGLVGVSQASIWDILFPQPKPKVPVYQAPEIDPASAMSALTLLAGGLAIVRGRRIKK